MPPAYVPRPGDVVWLEFDPQAGREQAGHRPALVLSPAIYNDKTSLMICCPMTTHIKGYPFEVILSNNPVSVVLADQVKNLDWRRRNAEFKERITVQQLAEVRAKAIKLIGG